MDTTADEAADLSVTVDSVINNEESDDVTLTLSGVDADADSVSVTLTDSEGAAVTAAAVADNNGDWTVDISSTLDSTSRAIASSRTVRFGRCRCHDGHVRQQRDHVDQLHAGHDSSVLTIDDSDQTAP